MRAFTALIVGACLLLIASPPLAGWGMDVHRLITRRAIENLPPALTPAFIVKIDFIAEHSVDPDLWRVMALKGDLGEEDPNHFFNIDGFGEPAPFRGIPHEWAELVKKYGADTANRNGHLPWRAQEVYDRLVAAFRGVPTRTPSYALDNARYLSAILAHYIEDAHVPFHAVVDHDGEATNQTGIHTRFETDAVLRNIHDLKLAQVTITPITGMRDFIFQTVADSNALVPSILAADRKAYAGRQAYDDGYYAAFYAGVKPIIEQRFGDAASAVASAIVSAWNAAGRPALLVDPADAPARMFQ